MKISIIKYTIPYKNQYRFLKINQKVNNKIKINKHYNNNKNIS